MYCSVANMVFNSLRLDVCQNILLKVEDGNGGRERETRRHLQTKRRASKVVLRLNMQFELYDSHRPIPPACLLRTGRKKTEIRLCEFASTSSGSLDTGSHNLIMVFYLIQYNLDSTCRDSTFYRLARHFLLEYITYFVTEINHLIPTWNQLVCLMALKPRGTYYPGCTVSAFSICHNKYNFADPQTLLHAWFITKC